MANEAKDFWDKVDIVLRPLNGLLTAAAVALLGYYTTNTLRQRETRETNERVYTELMSSREQAESGLRKDMFLSVMEGFLRTDAEGLEPKMLNLEMLAYNFHESLNLKPIFSHMDRLISSSRDSSSESYRERLNEVALEIISRQIVLLEQVGQKFSRSVDLTQLTSGPGYIDVEPGTLTLENIERVFSLAVVGVNKQRRELTVELKVRTPQDSTSAQSRMFTVAYYDFPMIDNTRLSRDQRASVVLNQFGEDSAELTLVYFPGSYASLKEKISYDEVVEKLRVLGQSE